MHTLAHKRPESAWPTPMNMWSAYAPNASTFTYPRAFSNGPSPGATTRSAWNSSKAALVGAYLRDGAVSLKHGLNRQRYTLTAQLFRNLLDLARAELTIFGKPL